LKYRSGLFVVYEIDQDTPASSASQFKEPGLKNNVSVESKFASKN